MSDGIFITFEGTDGVGKSTQIKFIYNYLIEKGYDVLLTREPGGCPISEKIRNVILDIDNSNMVPECEALLYAAARAQHMKEVILPAIAEGKIVICDRFYDSSIAYQAYGRGLGEDMIRAINEPALYGRLPDATILLSIPPQDAFLRKHGNKDDRIELSGEEFFDRAYYGFMESAKKEPSRIHVIDASAGKEETHKKILKLINELLNIN